MQGNLARDSQSAKLASVNSVKIQSNQLALFDSKKFSFLQQASAFVEQLSDGWWFNYFYVSVKFLINNAQFNNYDKLPIWDFNNDFLVLTNNTVYH